MTWIMQNKRPPLGLTSKHTPSALREEQIKSAMLRYFVAGKEIPHAWLEEYNELVQAAYEQ